MTPGLPCLLLAAGKTPQPHSIPLCLTPTLLSSLSLGMQVFHHNLNMWGHVQTEIGLWQHRWLLPARPWSAQAAIFSAPPPSAGLRHFQADLSENNGHGRSPALQEIEGLTASRASKKVSAITTFRFHLGEKTREKQSERYFYVLFTQHPCPRLSAGSVLPMPAAETLCSPKSLLPVGCSLLLFAPNSAPDNNSQAK